MSMNKDLVAQAVAAIPLWMAFLDQKEAEQDALLSQMQGTKKTSFMDQATSFLKKKENNPPTPSATSPNEQPPLGQPNPASSDKPSPLDLNKPSADDPKEDIRWAPAAEDFAAEEEEEADPEKEKENNQFSNMF